MLRPRAGAASSARGIAIRIAARPGRRRARGGDRRDAGAGGPARAAADPAGVDPLTEQGEQAGQAGDGDEDAEDRGDADRGRQREQQRAGLDEGGEGERGEQGRAGEDGGAPGGARGCAARPRVGCCPRRAPRGSGRRSAASSRRPAPGPSSCRRRARSRRSVITELSRTRTPRPAKTVRAPKASGIAAATTERKTSSRTRRRSGAASSSARSVALIVSSCRARETEANPDWVARSGWCTWAVEDPFEFGDRVAHRRRERHVVVDDHERIAGPRAQSGDRAAVPGRDHRRVRRVAQGADQGRPLPFDLGRRAAEQDGELRGVAEVLLGELFPFGRRGAGDRQRERVELALDPEPDQAEDKTGEDDRDESRKGRTRLHLRLPRAITPAFSQARGRFANGGVPQTYRASAWIGPRPAPAYRTSG